MTYATVFLVNFDEAEPTRKRLEKKYPGITKKMKRGDIIENLSQSGYRSQGVYFWDGTDVIDQCYEFDDYGSVSKEFLAITEFHPHYWDNDKMEVNNDYEEGSSQFCWHIDETVVYLDLTEINGAFDMPVATKKYEGITEYALKFTHNSEEYLLVYCSELPKHGYSYSSDSGSTYHWPDGTSTNEVPEGIDYIDDADQFFVFTCDLRYNDEKFYGEHFGVDSNHVFNTIG